MGMSNKMWLIRANCSFLYFTNAPTEVMKALPDVDAATNERRLKTVVFFHD